ncbi:sphingosine-1-phosphate phosphatase 2-like [Diaphorina citri]|uniref:Sphingosine-1-phosphate phosphatase 2-like n=1 Tax=Diaphorina citri TaxID=121845 RepID=A0A3Q0J6S9_DIACI|nr:sphingosine-1-phosphate phosphatase 2-like [Diaphorina citri]
MHTVLDVLVGVVLAVSLVVITVPIVRNFDTHAVAWKGTPLVFFIVTLSLVIFYPKCDQWTPTRPRPICPPAVRVQSKWSLEYGMPSTHAMIAVAIPMASILFTVDKYNYPLPLAITVAVLVCVWVCTSRIYLGMHTVLDVLVGVVLAVSLVVITVPIVRNFDTHAVAWKGTPLVFFIVTLSLVIFYPKCDQWTPTR